MITVIAGGIGNGKTLYETYRTLEKVEKGYTIISNYKLELPVKHYINDVQTLAKLVIEKPKKDFVHASLDEGWLYFDSRLSGSLNNIQNSHFTMQTRKVKTDIEITAQHFRQVDKRIRDVTDEICIPKILIYQNIHTEDIIFHKPLDLWDYKPLLMEVRILRKNELGAWIDHDYLRIPTPDELLSLYDTDEVITSEYVNQLTESVKA